MDQGGEKKKKETASVQDSAGVVALGKKKGKKKNGSQDYKSTHPGADKGSHCGRKKTSGARTRSLGKKRARAGARLVKKRRGEERKKDGLKKWTRHENNGV